MSAPPFSKGRWLRLGEDGGIETGRKLIQGLKFDMACGQKSAVAVGGRQRLVQGLIRAPCQLLPFPKGGGFALAKTEGLKLAGSLYMAQEKL